MKYAMYFLSFPIGVALMGITAQAACGGGGFKSVKVVTTQQEAPREGVTQEYRNSKLEGLQRDVDKAQAKFDRCEGDCDKERRKLEEAKAKLAKKAGEL